MSKTVNFPALLDGLKIWVVWILTTLLSFSLASVPAVSIALFIGMGDPEGGAWAIAGAIIGAISGLVVGGCHWLILGLRFHLEGRWFGATIIGLILSTSTIFMLQQVWFEILPSSLLAVSAGSIVGVILGLSQWLALRGAVKRAILWIPTTIAGWICAVLVVLFLKTLLISDIAALITGGVILGMVTGIGFVYLFDQSGQGTFNTLALAALGLFVILAAGWSLTWMYNEQRLTLPGHASSVISVAYASDGNLLGSGSLCINL